jgi:hypothetical protein
MILREKEMSGKEMRLKMEAKAKEGLEYVKRYDKIKTLGQAFLYIKVP